VWASPVPEDRVGPAVDLETVAAAEAAGAKSGEASRHCFSAAQLGHCSPFEAILECTSYVRSGASPAASGAEDGADSGDNMDSFIVREDPPAAPIEPQVLQRVVVCPEIVA
jgi:hypothetical protein